MHDVLPHERLAQHKAQFERYGKCPILSVL